MTDPFLPFYIIPPIFICIMLLCIYFAYKRQKKFREQMIAQGYSLTYVQIGGREGVIAVPPQQNTVPFQNQPALPPPYFTPENAKYSPIQPPMYGLNVPNSPPLNNQIIPSAPKN